MPIITGSPLSPTTGQAAITGQVYFGNSALPNGQGIMGWINLSDFQSWFPQDYDVDGTNRQIGIAGLPYLGRSAYISDDFGAKSIVLPMRYYDGPGVLLGAAKAQLSQAGEQYLSLDNKATGALVKLKSLGTPKRLRKFQPFWWDIPGLEFVMKEPFFQDLAATSPPGFPIAQAGSVAPGTTVVTAIAYTGSVRTYPVYTLNIPVGNAVVINQFVLKNAMSGEQLTITFGPPLAAATAWTITVDCGAFSVVDQNGMAHDFIGSFPQLYGPAGQSQNIASTLITASGAAAGVTVGCTYQNRWEI